MSNAVDQNKSDQENDTKFGHFDTECSLNKSFNRRMLFYFDLQQKSLFRNIALDNQECYNIWPGK